MGTLNGTNMLVLLNGTAIALSKECDIDIQNAARDTTTKGSGGWKETASDGLRSWKVTGKGLADFGASGNFTTLYALLLARTSVTLKIDNAGSGNHFYYGSAVLKNLKGGGPLEDSAPFDFEFEGNGILTETSHT